MTTLAEFLLARIAEDETAAKAAPPLEHNYDMGGHRQDERWVFDRRLPSSADGMGNWSPHNGSPTTAAHFSRHDPARVLAECAAKRSILQQCNDVQRVQRRCGDPELLSIRHIVRCLALPYAEHPDYNEEWRP